MNYIKHWKNRLKINLNKSPNVLKSIFKKKPETPLVEQICINFYQLIKNKTDTKIVDFMMSLVELLQNPDKITLANIIYDQNMELDIFLRNSLKQVSKDSEDKLKAMLKLIYYLKIICFKKVYRKKG
jgi:hypothetical protein